MEIGDEIITLKNGTGDTSNGFDWGFGLGDFNKWLGTDSAKNSIGLSGLAFEGWGAKTKADAAKQAKKQWEAENARANEIMAMNRERYNTFVADKAKLNSGYAGGGLAGSGYTSGGTLNG